LMWTYTLPADRSVEILNEAGYPLFTTAIGCARTMRAMADFRALHERTLRKKPAEMPAPHPGCAKVRAALATEDMVMTEWCTRALLDAYGIGGGARTLARSAAEARTAAKAVGRPVALKVQSADIRHKTEAGAVLLNVGVDEAQVGYERVLANAMRHAPTAHIEGVLVEAMAPAGRELILGVNRDPCWGPLLMVGLGGVLVEVLRDVVLAPLPFDRDTAMALLGRLKGAAVLGPYRGMPAADTEALADLMVRLSQFALDHAEAIAQIDLNPVIVHSKGDGVSVVDALIIKHAAQQAERRSAAE
jgi:acetate---CoA ligase (ADP-forming)